MSSKPVFELTEKYGWVIPTIYRDKEFKLGIIGLSTWYSASFIAYSEMIRGVRVTAAADLGRSDEYVKECLGMTKKEYSEFFKVRLYEDPVEMIREEELNGVFICTENTEHAKYLELAVKEGVHAFIAKPIATSIDDMNRMIKAVEGTGLKVTTSSPARFDKLIRDAKDRVRRGEIGKPIMVRSLINIPVWHLPRWSLEREEEGDIWLYYGFYTADLSRWFLEAEAIRVYAEEENFTHRTKYPDNAKAIVRFENGAIASMDIYSSIEEEYSFPVWEIEVVGLDGCLRHRQDNFSVYYSSRKGSGLIQPYMNPVLAHEIASWIQSCVSSKEPEFTLLDAKAVIEICLACRESARMNKPVVIRSKNS